MSEQAASPSPVAPVATGGVVAAAIQTHYQDTIQISRGQATVIGSAIAGRGPGAKVLVFGCGNDSPLWAAMNPGGETVFLENHRTWLPEARERFPDLDIREISYRGRTVADSLPIDEAELARFPVPDVIASAAWDVILVDSPMGSKLAMPGRSLSIYWSHRVATESTHVFVDDYRRPLERAYADHFFRSRRPWNIEVPRVLRHGIRNAGVMLWSVGV
ncbi:hypothetical protein [Brevundimonas sp.]|uniref:hypothetical protein n=1 Tax=Brevundimonas sp. TaxID=1871086 RepID=UPI0035B10BB1